MNTRPDSSVPAPLTLIKAGAGAGKTHRIMEALTQWIANGHVAADKVLAVTFTHAAADEMKARVKEELLKQGLFDKAALIAQSNISTIHSFGTELIKQFAYEQGISPKPRLIKESEQKQMLKQALEQVSEVAGLVDKMEALFYGVGFGLGGFQSAADNIRKTMMSCIDRLRSLGKDASDEKHLIESAISTLNKAYGYTSDGEALTQNLRKTVRELQAAYPTKEDSPEQWSTNAASRKFLDALYSTHCDDAVLDDDWKLWAALQTIKAPGIVSDKKQGPGSHLVLAVWEAADKLSVHPGPLVQQQTHITALLTGALSALQQYQVLKRSSSLIDFGDMVGLANRIVSNPDFLSEACEQYQCLIIDEFQDTNPLQFALLRHFQKQGLPTLIVGDLKQSIMGFQGADRRVFKSLLEKSSADEQEELTNNWRSTSQLMDFINQMGATFYGAEYQTLTPQVPFKSHLGLKPVQVLEFKKTHWNQDRLTADKMRVVYEGYAALAKHIKCLLAQDLTVIDKETQQSRSIRASDIAVLSPKHKALQNLSEYIHQAGLKTLIKAPGFLEMSIVQCLLNVLQAVANPNDQYSLLSVITSEFFTDDASAALQENLSVYLKQRKFTNPVSERLSSLPNNLYAQPLQAQLLEIVDELSVMEILNERSKGREQRAAVLKLIGLAQEFDQLNSVPANAEGIYGKTAPAFAAWLKQLTKDPKSSVGEKPGLHDTGSDAVVMSTWHGSKGLEWPIVMVLGGDDVAKTDLTKMASISMAYKSDELEQMLPTSHVQILPKFADKTSCEKMLKQIEDEERQTQLNLFYVALTRAREQVILPWFEGFKDGSMLSVLNPIFDEGKSNFEYDRKVMSSEDTKLEPIDNVELGEATELAGGQPLIYKREITEVLPHTINPSNLDHEPTDTVDQKDEWGNYHTGLDLSYLDHHMAANDTGTLIHRFYQVYLQRPELLSKLLEQNAHIIKETEATLLKEHLDGFKLWMQQHLKNMISWQSEVPILSSNEQGQTISGSIDLLVECTDGYWIIDHKTDRLRQPSAHRAQLQAYRQCLTLDKPVIGLAINWIRMGGVDCL
jgi:ATP-dependent helicase/nuclease subunit A